MRSKLVTNNVDGYLITKRVGIVAAAPIETTKDWQSGKEYDIEITPMSDGRLMFYKSTKHYNENSGYKVYNDIKAVEDDFKLIVGEREVSRVKA
jgi:hypothetical protein